MSKGTIRKFVDESEDLDRQIKQAVTNESILQGRTVTEKELLTQWIEEGAKKPKIQNMNE